ncbi:MAG: 6-phosphogluconolactonase [Prolixibacteraceae bacterium]|jgi:6-phosphogluconolactonase|nr:6-phosphogluconolactonase [Prolixibacteraceae bacterium]
MKRELQIFSNPEALAEQVSVLLMGWIEKSSNNKFHLAISGGSTPNLLFSALATSYSGSTLWQKTHIWWVDERMVAPNDPESNFGVAKKLLLSKIAIPETNIHRILGEQVPYQEAENYSRQIREQVPMKDVWPRFDLIFLGIGDDGHTASIFPNQMELLQSDRICEIATHPVTHQQRVTLTGRAIDNADKICFLVTGANKAERMSEIWSKGEKGKKLPAGWIHPTEGQSIWFADEKATTYIR